MTEHRLELPDSLRRRGRRIQDAMSVMIRLLEESGEEEREFWNDVRLLMPARIPGTTRLVLVEDGAAVTWMQEDP